MKTIRICKFLSKGNLGAGYYGQRAYGREGTNETEAEKWLQSVRGCSVLDIDYREPTGYKCRNL